MSRNFWSVISSIFGSVSARILVSVTDKPSSRPTWRKKSPEEKCLNPKIFATSFAVLDFPLPKPPQIVMISFFIICAIIAHMQPQTFVFFGIVGSGKGTQVKLLMDFLKTKDSSDIVYAYPGNEYRKLIESDSYTGSIIKDSMERGNLQPDFLTDSIVTNILTSSLTNEKHLIADGYPRTVAQSEAFDAMIKFFKRERVKIVYIELSKEEAMRRNLLRGRADDTKEGIEKRFDEYINKVIPAMNYFKDKENYKIYTINGEQSVEDVHKDIIKALNF